MRRIRALFTVAAIVGGSEALGAVPADAQCSVFSRHPCVPNVCSVLSRHPCVPEPLYPFGENLQLTIVSAASDQPADSPDQPAAPAAQAASAAQAAATDGERRPDSEHPLDTIADLFDALRACWLPPPQDEARPGMQMSVRLSFRRSGQMIGAPRVTYASPDAPAAARNIYHDAIMAALMRCTPLPFTTGLGGALAGRPIAIRYVDNRNLP
jgi:hypothetical protein